MVKLLTRKKGKKLLSPAARTPSEIRENFPMFQYAMNEFAQTVLPQSSNDDGRHHDEEIRAALRSPLPPSAIGGARGMSGPVQSAHSQQSNAESTVTDAPPIGPQIGSSLSTFDSGIASSDENIQRASTSPYIPMGDQDGVPQRPPGSTVFYTETYGAAYTGGPIKYIYPHGYQSMRPRGCPWKLSICVFMLFTWLSIFIVGHCSDQQKNEDEVDVDDDLNIAIQMRWCGSRPLYFLWVCSMWITGLSAAYCGVIGYIKVRDFSVANARSQPPGIMPHKSDYHVHEKSSGIYQSDGNPQFWGAHISRPTQAAVAVTSR